MSNHTLNSLLPKGKKRILRAKNGKFLESLLLKTLSIQTFLYRKAPMYFHAFTSRNYRLFFAGQSCTLIGSWMQQAAMSWLIYRLSNSAALLGFAIFLAQAPVLFMAPMVNKLSTRISRQKLFLWLKVAAFSQAFALTVLAWGGWAQPWNILALCLMTGLINGLESPLRQSLVPYMVEDRAALSNAIVLNSLNINVARLTGPLFAGIAISLVGEPICFLINSLTYVVVIFFVTRMRLPHSVMVKSDMKSSLREAVAYAWRKPRIRTALLLTAVMSATFTPYYTVLPVYARDILLGDATTMGSLMSWVGLGAMVATLILLFREKKLRLSTVTIYSTLITGISVLLFSMNTSLPAAYALGVAIGFGTIMTISALNVVLQTQSAPAMRSRIMQIFTMANMGVIPFGGLVLAGLGHFWGTAIALTTLAGVGLIILFWVILRTPPVRRHIRTALRSNFISNRASISEENNYS